MIKYIHCIRNESHNEVHQYSCLEKPLYRGAWQATVHGVAKNWTWLSDYPCIGILIHWATREALMSFYRKESFGRRQSPVWRLKQCCLGPGASEAVREGRGERPGIDASLQRQHGSSSTWISDLQPPELWDHKFLLFKPLSPWYFVTAPETYRSFPFWHKL